MEIMLIVLLIKDEHCYETVTIGAFDYGYFDVVGGMQSSEVKQILEIGIEEYQKLGFEIVSHHAIKTTLSMSHDEITEKLKGPQNLTGQVEKL